MLFFHFPTQARFVDLISCLTVLDNAAQPALEKLSMLWEIYDTYGDDTPPMDNALAVLCACCNTDNDRLAIEKLFKEHFRPACYKRTLQADTGLQIRPIASSSSKLLMGGSPSHSPTSIYGSPLGIPRPGTSSSSGTSPAPQSTPFSPSTPQNRNSPTHHRTSHSGSLLQGMIHTPLTDCICISYHHPIL